MPIYSVGAASGLSLKLYSGLTSGGPTGLLTALSGNSAPTVLANYVYTANLAVTLQANQTYWLVASAVATAVGTYFKVSGTDSRLEDGGGLPGWSISDNRALTNNGGASWFGSVSGTPVLPRYSVQVSVPESSGFSIFVIAATSLILFSRWDKRSGRRAAES